MPSDWEQLNLTVPTEYVYLHLFHLRMKTDEVSIMQCLLFQPLPINLYSSGRCPLNSHTNVFGIPWSTSRVLSRPQHTTNWRNLHTKCVCWDTSPSLPAITVNVWNKSFSAFCKGSLIVSGWLLLLYGWLVFWLLDVVVPNRAAVSPASVTPVDNRRSLLDGQRPSRSCKKIM